MPEVAIINKAQVKDAQFSGAFETFNGLIYDMRQQGFTLQEIGLEIGRTKERVRQILVEHYGSTEIKRELVTTSQLATQADCRPLLIEKLRREGLIAPIRRRIWDPNATLPILIQNKPICRICAKPVPKYRACYCSEECRTEAGRYKNRPDEVKWRQNERVRRWGERNPDRQAEIQRGSSRRYLHKHGEEQYRLFTSRFTKIIPVKLD